MFRFTQRNLHTTNSLWYKPAENYDSQGRKKFGGKSHPANIWEWLDREVGKKYDSGEYQDFPESWNYVPLIKGVHISTLDPVSYTHLTLPTKA